MIDGQKWVRDREIVDRQEWVRDREIMDRQEWETIEKREWDKNRKMIEKSEWETDRKDRVGEKGTDKRKRFDLHSSIISWRVGHFCNVGLKVRTLTLNYRLLVTDSTPRPSDLGKSSVQ